MVGGRCLGSGRGLPGQAVEGHSAEEGENKSAELQVEFDKRIPCRFADFEIFKLGYFSPTICCCCGGCGGGGRVLAIAAIHSPRSFKRYIYQPLVFLFLFGQEIWYGL